MVHLLLPFTHGIDTHAITSAFALTQRLNARLILLSLIQQPERAGKSPRWEDIQQSRDFLEFAYHKAQRTGVPVERMELYTHNAPRTIRTIAQEMDCAGIVLVVRRGTGVLLATQEVKQILEQRSLPVYVVSLLARKPFFSFPRLLPRKPREADPDSFAGSVLHWHTLSDQARYQSHGQHVLKDS